MSDRVEAVKQVYAQRLREYYEARYESYRSGTELDDPYELGQQNLVLDGKREELPAPVREVWEMAIDKGESYYPTIYQIPVQEQDTYAVRIRTDGDDGWLAIFNAEGDLLALAQTYIEVVVWADIDSLPIDNLLSVSVPGIEEAASQTLWERKPN
ncbi:hypothetical protein IFO70_21735 [Phormidium tenue FACHB-886]|nr:hypothetical protein [Phormidium tenue FACHB-886]